MSTLRAPRRAVLAAALVWPLTVPSAARAQPTADSTLRARGAAGSARVALDGATARMDGGQYNDYGVSAAAFPFVGEHLQVGLAPTYNGSTDSEGPNSRGYTLAGVANYVAGRGSRWLGYAGGYAATTRFHLDAYSPGAPPGNPGLATFSVPGSRYRSGAAGLQAGALYFLNPAVAVRAELRYRALTSGSSGVRTGVKYGTAQLLVRLDPYLFGRAGEGAPVAAGLGVVDVDGYLTHSQNPYRREHEWGAGVLAAPYLTQWAQVGVDAQAYRGSAYSGYGSYTARGFGRLYLPLTARTQPFAEGFVSGYSAYSANAPSRRGLLNYGGTVGVRQMLNPRVALDVGVRRAVPTRQTFDVGSYRGPGQTGLAVGLATRLGRAR